MVLSDAMIEVMVFDRMMRTREVVKVIDVVEVDDVDESDVWLSQEYSSLFLTFIYSMMSFQCLSTKPASYCRILDNYRRPTQSGVA